MPQLSEISYSREETIQIVRDYYTFLTTMYLDESWVIEPPVGGWPSITANKFRGMEKTDEVIQLLRHLPYIKAPKNGSDPPQGAAFCKFADYQSFRPEGDDTDESLYDDDSLKVCSEGGGIYEDVPAHVVGLTYGSRDNPVFLLDTELGIVHWIECPGGVRHNFGRSEDDEEDGTSHIEEVDDDPYDWAPENEQDWRADGGTWAIADFFEVLKQQFYKLNFIPLSKRTVVDIWASLSPGTDGIVPDMQQIWRSYGWPEREGEGRFDKKACLSKVRHVIKASYPRYDDDWQDWQD